MLVDNVHGGSLSDGFAKESQALRPRAEAAGQVGDAHRRLGHVHALAARASHAAPYGYHVTSPEERIVSTLRALRGSCTSSSSSSAGSTAATAKEVCRLRHAKAPKEAQGPGFPIEGRHADEAVHSRLRHQA